ncbi:ArsR/SmtB family transcription factor [Streptomyces sp. NPDC086080]|uniref:ArsR/SmtB family transcription factor n=1 Tax=Streptomyces sp. NPDC086080 TaxID=3365748 RepID=UPI0037D21651
MAGTLSIHFTSADFLHVRFARSPDPMWEAVLGLHVLTTPADRLPARLRLWRRRARERAGRAEVRAAFRMLHALAPSDASYWPDFLTPAESEEGLTAGLRVLRETSRARLEREMREASRHRPLPAWARRLAAGDRTVLDDVANAVGTVHGSLLAPDWSEVEATGETDRARRMEAFEGGLGAVFASFPPFVWRDPVLSAPYPVDRVIRLRGRGLRLVPSFFCHTRPVAIADPRLPPVVVYPLHHDDPPAALSGTRPGVHRDADAALARLLGRNRARVLTALVTTRTTGDVAARLALPASSVSGHLTVLRNAGLVASERTGAHVTHRLTPRGRHLLDGGRGDGVRVPGRRQNAP